MASIIYTKRREKRVHQPLKNVQPLAQRARVLEVRAHETIMGFRTEGHDCSCAGHNASHNLRHHCAKSIFCTKPMEEQTP